jgi:mRNA-degrading endonuclease RelE of RelBE toxin-antitoxin system
VYAPEVQDHLRRFAKRDQTMILDTVPRQLAHQPALPTRNRKPLDANPIAPWELRIGGYRVYFEVKEQPARGVTTDQCVWMMRHPGPLRWYTEVARHLETSLPT